MTKLTKAQKEYREKKLKDKLKEEIGYCQSLINLFLITIQFIYNIVNGIYTFYQFKI